MINSMPTALLTKIGEKRIEMQRIQAEFAKELQASIGPVFQEFFDKHAPVAKITWTQYTPHFNDGEPCEFSVNEPELHFRYVAGLDEEVDEDDYEEGLCAWSLGRSTDPRATPELKADFEAICGLIRSDEDAMQTIFGSDAKVTASKDGLEVDEYDHD